MITINVLSLNRE